MQTDFPSLYFPLLNKGSFVLPVILRMYTISHHVTVISLLSAPSAHTHWATPRTNNALVFIHEKINTIVSYLTGFVFPCRDTNVRVSNIVLKAEKKYCQHCKLSQCFIVWQIINTVSWNDMNLTEHCLAAGFRKTSHCFWLLWFFSHSKCHCGGPPSWQHAAGSGWDRKDFLLAAWVWTQRQPKKKKSQMFVTCALEQACKHRQGFADVLLCVCGSDPLVECPEHRLKKTGPNSETASRENTAPKLQVETIQDWSSICFHFRLWLFPK